MGVETGENELSGWLQPVIVIIVTNTIYVLHSILIARQVVYITLFRLLQYLRCCSGYNSFIRWRLIQIYFNLTSTRILQRAIRLSKDLEASHETLREYSGAEARVSELPAFRLY